jgi:hypothetical protein
MLALLTRSLGKGSPKAIRYIHRTHGGRKQRVVSTQLRCALRIEHCQSRTMGAELRWSVAPSRASQMPVCLERTRTCESTHAGGPCPAAPGTPYATSTALQVPRGAAQPRQSLIYLAKSTLKSRCSILFHHLFHQRRPQRSPRPGAELLVWAPSARRETPLRMLTYSRDGHSSSDEQVRARQRRRSFVSSSLSSARAVRRRHYVRYKRAIAG